MAHDRQPIRPTEWYSGYSISDYEFCVGINKQLNQVQVQLIKRLPKCGCHIMNELGWSWHNGDKVWYKPIHPARRKRDMCIYVNEAVNWLMMARDDGPMVGGLSDWKKAERDNFEFAAKFQSPIIFPGRPECSPKSFPEEERDIEGFSELESETSFENLPDWHRPIEVEVSEHVRLILEGMARLKPEDYEPLE
ncbi:MAG: hypothetical protein P4L85_14095 [Paludisphaera borealis]|uniref:hypothetical protein n=1 Tax=Paludisphaera borealis TaxID=1387353 RepID=UPI00283EE07B|nr:hypothetical protein [Paludisphaera borealis]MDR3620478.1 hypothetical protein [Paludisphaera borealis]